MSGNAVAGFVGGIAATMQNLIAEEDFTDDPSTILLCFETVDACVQEFETESTCRVCFETESTAVLTMEPA